MDNGRPVLYDANGKQQDEGGKELLVDSPPPFGDGGLALPRKHVAAPPKGVILQTKQEIHDRAAMVNQQVWVTRVMPPGNLTEITEAERRLIARWIKGGAE